MERWDDLRIFLAAFREGSCAAAGARLGVNQSTISRRISALERELGVRLFDRTPEGLVPTAAAEEIVPRAELFEVTAAELIGAIEGLDTRPGGVVRVASPVLIASELLAPALPAFLDEQPGLRLELIVGDAIVDLSRREADLALRFVRPDRGDLLVRRVGTLRFAVFGFEGLSRCASRPAGRGACMARLGHDSGATTRRGLVARGVPGNRTGAAHQQLGCETTRYSGRARRICLG